MNYRIEHETSSRIRVRVCKKRLSPMEEEKIHYVLDQIPGVRSVEVYNATAGIAVYFDSDRDEILTALGEMSLSEVRIPKNYIDQHDYVRMEELRKRHLGPKVKMQMRGKILAEMAFDLIAPMPIQAGFHLYQLITLKNI